MDLEKEAPLLPTAKVSSELTVLPIYNARLTQIEIVVNNFDDSVPKVYRLGCHIAFEIAYGKLRHIFPSQISRYLMTKAYNQCVLPVIVDDSNS